MNNLKKICFYIIILIGFISSNTSTILSINSLSLPVTITTSPEDTEYLRTILKQAFDSIYYYRHPVTGLCSYHPENPISSEYVKTELIFFSFISVAIAGKTGILDYNIAKKEIDKTLSWIEKFPTCEGFFWNKYSTTDGSISPKTDWYWNKYVLADMGFNFISLIVVKEIFPEFANRIDKLLHAVNWKKLYNKDKNSIYDCITINPNGKITAEGKVVDLANDTRPGIFLTIASGAAPASIWNNCSRNYVKRYNVKYLKPGESLGYNEQTFSLGYFLDERGSKIGLSNANLAWGQICYAHDMGFPTWGWSSCLKVTGNRYLGWGNPDTDWSIINSHAVAAVVNFYPNQVVKAFKIMEKLGMRKPFTINNKKYNFGFRDSIDIDTLDVPDGLIPGLDQSILFLSLANYLYDGVVWRTFQKNKMVQNGIKLIDEYRNPKKEYLKLYKTRDLKGPSLPQKKSKLTKKIIVDNFKKNKNNLNQIRFVRRASINIKKDIAKITFKSIQSGYLKENLAGIDLTDYNALKLKIRSNKPGKIMVILSISETKGYRSIQVDSINENWQEIIIPFRSFLGGKEGYPFGHPNPPMNWTAMWHDRSNGKFLKIGQDKTIKKPIESIELKEISFNRLSKKNINKAAKILKKEPSTLVEKDGTFDRMEKIDDWNAFDDNVKSKVSLALEDGKRGKCIVSSYNIGPNGGWIIFSRNVNLNIKKTSSIVFNFKAIGGPANLEMKLIDRTGATFIKIIKNIVTDTKWQKIKIKCNDIHYGWGGTKTDWLKKNKAVRLEFAITSQKQVEGIAYFDDLKIIK